MDPRDDDIQFDFFEDEPATTEAQSSQSRVRLPRRGGKGTGTRRPAGPPRGLTPILRLLALIVIIVAVLVFFGLLLQSCASTSKHDSYKSYMEKVATIAHSSQEDGTAVASALTTPGAKVSELVRTLSGIAEQERQNVSAAQHLGAPGPLRDENQHLVEALQLRVSGVQGLADTFQQTATSKATTGDAGLLAEQADRLLASDVVWADLFTVPAGAEMKRQGVSGVVPPDSKFVADREFTTVRSMTLVLQRLRGASTGGTPTGVHGTNIADVKVQPSGQTLSEATENTVTASTDLGFDVAIHNGGGSQEVGIKVTLTIQQNPAIVKTETLKLINPGETKTVSFKNLGSVKFAQREQVLVDVAPVLGEAKTDNTKATFPVIFSLG
jgi:hypothetical protein